MDETFERIHTVYDLIVYSYTQIMGMGENRIISRYYEELPGYRSKITNWMREMLLCNLSVEDFVKEWISYLQQDKEQVCMHVLMEFDRYYKERDSYPLIRELKTKKMIDYSTENNISDRLAFYPMGQDNFIMHAEVMKKARRHRMKSGIWEKISSYRINEISPLVPLVGIRKYNNNSIEWSLAQNGCLAIAMIPFSNQAPFDRDEKTGIWTRKNEDADYQKMYEDCIVLLEELNKRNIDIVVFPEIVMTEQLISDIKTWLMQNRDKAGNLKLLFMGSYYTENINRCVLLSGMGKELLANDKQNGFEYTDTQGKLHREELGVKSEKILLIDIKGLGRVWYLICKDDLIFENVAPFVSKYESTVQVISAYSSCLSEFRGTGEALAEKYQVFSAVSNSCAVRGGREIGIMGYPVIFEQGNSITGFSLEYACSLGGACCSYGRCAHIMRFDLENSCLNTKEMRSGNQVVTHNLVGIQIDYEQLPI